jgi:hypothetical protein
MDFNGLEISSIIHLPVAIRESPTEIRCPAGERNSNIGGQHTHLLMDGFRV